MKRKVSTDRLAIASLIIISTTLFFLAGYVNQVPQYDDKAYLNNALIHSGRLDKKDVLGPYADERPPLFWWLLTTIFLLNAPISLAKFLSPFFGVVLVVATYALTKKMFRSVPKGFYSGLFLASNAFMLSSTGGLLSDIPGTALSALTLLCIYAGVIEKRDSYLFASGPLLALSLMMRDQNLILIPIILFYLSTRLSLSSFLKTLVAFAAGLSLGLPVMLYGLIKTLTIVSNWATPIITGGAYVIPFTTINFTPASALSIIALYMAALFYSFGGRKRRRAYVPILSALLFFLTIYPYLWDNYLLGGRYEIQGQGVLSRLIAHQIMSETIGVGADLTAMARRIWWLSQFASLISPLIIVLSTVGLIIMIKKRRHSELAMLFPWLAFTSGFTIFFSYLEIRFLAPTLPVFAIIASYGFVETMDWGRFKLSRPQNDMGRASFTPKLGVIIEICLVSVSAWLIDIVLTMLDFPGKIGSTAVVDLLNMALSPQKGWFSDYLIYLQGKMTSPSFGFDPMFILESVLCLALVTYFPYGHLWLIQKLKPRTPLIVPITSKNVLTHLSDGPTLKQLTERINRELSAEVPPQSVGDILLTLQRKDYVFLEEGRWWRTPEGVFLLNRLLGEETSQRVTSRVCLYCGADLDSADKFCRICGRKTGGNGER